MTREEIQAIMREVNENRARLASCELHRFEPMGDPVGIRTRFKCRYCGGELDGAKVLWYDCGLTHGRRSRV